MIELPYKEHNPTSLKSIIYHYEWMLNEGIIKVNGSAHDRLRYLKNKLRIKRAMHR